MRRNAEADLLVLFFGASSAERRLAQVSRVALLDEGGVLSLTQCAGAGLIGDKDALAPYDGRGNAESAQFGSPGDVLFIAPFDGHPFFG